MTTSAGQTATEVRKEASPLEMIRDKLDEHNTQLSSAVGRIDTAMDRIAGPQPPHSADASEPDVPPEEPLITTISRMSDQQNATLQSLHSAIHRIMALS